MKKILFMMLSMAAFSAVIYSDGADTGTTLARGNIFPSFTAKNLDGANITVPDPVSPKVEVAVMTFSRQDTADTVSWLTSLKSAYKAGPGTAFWEVAVIPEMPFISGVILNGIKGALAQEQRGSFLIYSGDKDRMMKGLFVDDPSLFYVYVIGKDKRIKWSEKAKKPTEMDIEMMSKIVAAELKKD